MAILLIGAACGLLNGVLVAVGRLQPIIVTLATLSIFQGLAIRILPQPGGAIPDGFYQRPRQSERPFVAALYPAIGGIWAIFRRTRLGVSVFAVGNDAAAASSHGICPAHHHPRLYARRHGLRHSPASFLAANATAGDATTGDTYTLDLIVAAVLGGVSLFGGRGSGLGALFGAFVTVMVVNILFFAHIDPLYQPSTKGCSCSWRSFPPT